MLLLRGLMTVKSSLKVYLLVRTSIFKAGFTQTCCCTQFDINSLCPWNLEVSWQCGHTCLARCSSVAPWTNKWLFVLMVKILSTTFVQGMLGSSHRGWMDGWMIGFMFTFAQAIVL